MYSVGCLSLRLVGFSSHDCFNVTTFPPLSLFAPPLFVMTVCGTPFYLDSVRWCYCVSSSSVSLDVTHSSVPSECSHRGPMTCFSKQMSHKQFSETVSKTMFLLKDVPQKLFVVCLQVFSAQSMLTISKGTVIHTK